MASGGLRPVSEILAQVAAGSGGTAALRSERSPFVMAAAAAVGAGTAAASMSGAFPVVDFPTLPGLGDTHSFARIIEPTEATTASASTPSAPTSVAPAAAHMAPAPASAPARASVPTETTQVAYTARTGSSAGAPGGTVMASDLHQTDAMQIAALSHAVPMTSSATRAAPASSGSGGGALPASLDSSSSVGGLLGGAMSALALPTSISGVPIAGMAGSKTSAIALRQAITKKGLPYIWGGTGPRGYDCSGLVQWAFKQVGINLPRTSAAQSRVGKPVSRADLRPGDLVFFYTPVSHVGIYIGNNKIFNAFESGHPIKVSDMTHLPFHNARRIT
jgi:cell wall-associated NlpC family hydrolase